MQSRCKLTGWFCQLLYEMSTIAVISLLVPLHQSIIAFARSRNIIDVVSSCESPKTIVRIRIECKPQETIDKCDTQPSRVHSD